MKIAVVLLYGLYSQERKDYQTYLDFINEEIKNKNFDKVVLCGGFTDPKRSNESEASTVQKYLESLNPTFTNYVLEQQSINSNQNLEFAKTHIGNTDEIIIYCELMRKAKIIWIALHYLLEIDQKEILNAFMDFIKGRDIYKDFQYKTLSIVGFEIPGRSKEEVIGQTYATILDVLSLYSKDAEIADLEQRKKDFGLK